MLNPNGSYLIIDKSLWKDESLSKLATAVKNSKKSYIIYHDPDIISRAVITCVAIPLEELEQLQKTSKPSWWYACQELKEDKSNIGKLDSAKGLLYGFGFPDMQDVGRVYKSFSLDDRDYKEFNHVNGYTELRKKI